MRTSWHFQNVFLFQNTQKSHALKFLYRQQKNVLAVTFCSIDVCLVWKSSILYLMINVYNTEKLTHANFLLRYKSFQSIYVVRSEQQDASRELEVLGSKENLPRDSISDKRVFMNRLWAKAPESFGANFTFSVADESIYHAEGNLVFRSIKTSIPFLREFTEYVPDIPPGSATKFGLVTWCILIFSLFYEFIAIAVNCLCVRTNNPESFCSKLYHNASYHFSQKHLTRLYVQLSCAHSFGVLPRPNCLQWALLIVPTSHKLFETLQREYM